MTDVDFILNTLSPRGTNAIKIYKTMMSKDDITNFEELNLIGDENFIEEQKQKIRKREETVFEVKRKSLDQSLAGTGAGRVDINLIKSSSRKKIFGLISRNMRKQR
ncbi:MAG: hypothetical protein R6U91_05220 [Bacillota bacterium]